jgi:hypothetical protein
LKEEDGELSGEINARVVKVATAFKIFKIFILETKSKTLESYFLYFLKTMEHVTMYFSNIVFALNCLRITPFVNTALYLGNIGALLGVVVLLWVNPSFPYVHYQGIPLSNEAFNAALVAGHAVPVYLFRARQTLRETFQPNVIGAMALFFLVYFAVFRRKLRTLYAVSPAFFLKLAAAIGVLFLVIHFTNIYFENKK